MAFENVFGNIDYGVVPRARQGEADRMQRAIGQSIATAERAQDRELRRRQLEMRMAKQKSTEDADINAIAQSGYMTIAGGGEPTPEQIQAMDVKAAMMKPQGYVNQYGQPVVNQPVDPRTRLGQGMGAAPAQQAMDVAPQNAPMPGGNLPMQEDIPVGDTLPLLTPEQFEEAKKPKVTGPLAGTPRGAIMEEQAGMDVQKETIREEREAKNLMKYNQSQLEAASFANRMSASTDIMDSLTPESAEAKTGFLGGMAKVLTALPLGDTGTGLGEAAVKFGASDEQKRYLNAANNWVTANLRKESGAAIGIEEMAKEVAKYFPMPLDTAAVIADKKSLRGEAQKGMVGQAAGSYELQFGKKAKEDKKPKSGATSYMDYFK